MKIACADIGGTEIKYGLLERRASQLVIIKNHSCPTQAFEGGPAVARRVLKRLAQLAPFDAVGISTAGQVEPRDGSIRYATDNIPGYTGLPLQKLLEDTFSCPAAVENDVNAAALAEALQGAGRGYHQVLCLTYGTGIGGGLVCEGEIFHGAHGSAAELGHLVTHGGGERCTCGLQGCYEAYASVTALQKAVLEHTGQTWDGREIFARRHQQDIQPVLHRWMQEILYGLASAVHSFNPDCLVLGGGVMEQTWLTQALKDRLSAQIMPSYRDVAVLGAQLGNQAGMMGAALLAQRALASVDCRHI